MFEVLADLRSSIRVLRRRPVFTIVAITILAIGLSSGVAVFTYVNAFSQPFPGVDHQGLVRLFGVEEENPYRDISYLDFLDYAAGGAAAFEEIAAVQPYYAASVRRENMTEVALLEAASGGYFSVLGIETIVGRGLLEDDDRPGAVPVAVLSHSWWQRSFDGDPSVVGSTLYLNFRPFTIVGVASPKFLGAASDFRPDVWIPIAPFRDRYVNWSALAENRDVPLVRVYGRLKTGTRQVQGLAVLNTVAAGLDEAFPNRDRPRMLRVNPATWIDPSTRLAETPTLQLMMAAAGGLLLLVCANVTNLLLAIATGRQREIALRAAVGASPGRLVRQILAENMLLSTVAGAIALWLANPATARLGSYFARPSVWGANVIREASIDLRVVAFAIAASVLTGLAAGMLPALRACRHDLLNTLKTQAATSHGVPRRFFGRRLPGAHDLLVTMQIALSVVLLVVAGLVVRTLSSVNDRDPGFAYDQMVAAQISTSSTEIAVNDRERFLRELAAEIAREPWIRTATVVGNALLSPHPLADFRLGGQAELVPLVYSRVIPGFFKGVGIGVSGGRGFVAGDTTGSIDVAVVNESFASRYFPGATVLGRQLWWPGAGGAERRFEIVGVTPDVISQDFLAEPEPMVYFSYPQHAYSTSSALMITTAIDPSASIPLLYRWLRDFEPYLAIVNVLPYSEIVRGFLYTQRMNAELFSVLAFFGLVLSAVGVFGVMSLTVSQRTREVGIRMAIGAQRRDIGVMIIKQAMIPVALGLAVGLATSFLFSELVRTLLYGIEPTDPVALVGGTTVLVAAALAAAYIPSRRAATADPVTALRTDQ